MPSRAEQNQLIERILEENTQIQEDLRLKSLEADGMASELRESMRELSLALEDRGWMPVYGAYDQYEADGLALDTIKTVSDKLRSHLVAGALIKRIAELRGNYIYGEYFTLKDIKPGLKTAMAKPKNEAVLFSVEALLEVNRAHATDGNLFMLVNTKSKDLQRIPLDEITAHYANPDDNEDIWAVRRAWTRINTQGKTEVVHRWYKTDMAPASFKRTYLPAPDGSRVTVDRDWVAVVDRVNSQVGWTWGIPDLLASLQWAEAYSKYLKSQAKFAEALSAIAVQYKAKTAKGAQNAQSIVAQPGIAGSAVTGEMDIIAQRGSSDVSFENGKALASAAAAAAEVDVIAALSDAGAGSGSFGAAKTLADPTQRMVKSRRAAFARFLNRVFTQMGAKNVVVSWPQITDDPLHRQLQAITSIFETGLFEGEEIRRKLIELADIETNQVSPPEGFMLPNNEKSINRRDVDPNTSGSGGTEQKFQNRQGVDALGVGKIDGDSNELRDEENS